VTDLITLRNVSMESAEFKTAQARFTVGKIKIL
jgi:hypothetical protein